MDSGVICSLSTGKKDVEEIPQRHLYHTERALNLQIDNIYCVTGTWTMSARIFLFLEENF